MAYQNVGTPRFYVNVLEWLHHVGYITISDRLMTLPVLNSQTQDTGTYEVSSTMSGGKNFHLVLNYGVGDSFQLSNADYSHLINGGTYSGFRLSIFPTTVTSITFTGGGGSLIAGTYYDMNAPDLSLTMEWEYGETKEITTYNGSSISNTMGNRASFFGDYPAWELVDDEYDTWYGNDPLSRSGRRIWSLKFSFIDRGNLWGSNQSLATGEWGVVNTGLDDVDYHTAGNSINTFNKDILTDYNFFSQVYVRTLGGTIPFIFAPDGGGEGAGNNINPDQFAICKIRDNSMKATQTAPNVYDMSMVIEEVW